MMGGSFNLSLNQDHFFYSTHYLYSQPKSINWCISHVMASEFHLFTSLPTELRLKIWEYALRQHQPSRPGAHFFSITNLREDGGELIDLGVQCEWGSRCIHNHGDTYCLAAPKFGSSHSWTSNNPSSYLWDFGMWTACRESRVVIEDHYKLDYWATKLGGGATAMSYFLLIMSTHVYRLYFSAVAKIGTSPYAQTKTWYVSSRSIQIPSDIAEEFEM